MSQKLKLFISVLSLLAVIAVWATFRLFSPFADKASAPLTLTVNPSDSTFVIANQLAELSQKNGGTLSSLEIRTLALLMGGTKDIKAGDYEFSATTKLNQVLNKLFKGNVVAHTIRIPEGVTWREIKQALSTADLEHNAQNLDVAQAAQALKIDAPSIEGMVFPDTYQYRKGETETAVLARAHQLLNKKLALAWEKRAPNLPYKTPYEALIMASIIEKETGTANDRVMVAAVFVNRLKIPMRLQTDPSVIYGMGERFKGNITKADLRQDTPFNTYTRDGLTPTPIATASAASMHAALNPAADDALYFVARGDGSSQFSRTLPEHNAAVQKYQLIKKAQTSPSPSTNNSTQTP